MPLNPNIIQFKDAQTDASIYPVGLMEAVFDSSSANSMYHFIEEYNVSAHHLNSVGNRNGKDLFIFSEAIALVPADYRHNGLTVTFKTDNNGNGTYHHTESWVFKGTSTTGTGWSNASNWVEFDRNYVDLADSSIRSDLNQLGQQVIYDVTMNNSNHPTFASLLELLSDANLSTLIPANVRCGGMSIRFVRTSDNKYVQYRLTSQNFNTTPANWQKLGAEVSVSQNTSTGDDSLMAGSSELGKFADAGKLIKINAMLPQNSSSWPDLPVGTYNYNTTAKKISFKSGASQYDLIPFYSGAVYTYNNELYIWNGTDLVNIYDTFKLLGSKYPNLSSSDSANDIRYNSIYLAVNATNMPSTSTYLLITMVSSGSEGASNKWITQIAVRDADNQFFVRCGYYSNSASWKDWMQVASTDKILDYIETNTIKRSKLSDEFMCLFPAISGDLNSVLAEGHYLVVSGATNVPLASATLTLEVKTFKSTEGGNAWTVQYCHTTDGTPRMWFRKCYKGANWSTWVEMNNPAKKPAINSGDLNNVLEVGNYLLTGTVSNVPISGTLTIEVLAFQPILGGNTWYVQKATTADGAVRQFIRKCYNGSNWSDWVETTNNYMDFRGKKIACFGDSITEKGDYPSRLAEKLRATTYKCGFGGCRMTSYGNTESSTATGYSAMCMSYLSDYIADNDFTDLLQAADDVYAQYGDDNRTQALLVSQIDYSELDYMILFWGTNDYGGNMPIGQDTDEGHTTFKGAINLIVKNILTAYPNIHLIFFTPFWRATYTGESGFCDSDTYTNPLGFKLPDYVDALVSRANALHIPVVNLYDSMCIGKYNYTEWLIDGLHPKDGIGYEYVAEKVASGFKRFYHD